MVVISVIGAVYVLLLSVAILFKVYHRNAIEMLPSFFWASMMVVPFLVQVSYFSPLYIGIQASGIFGVGFALLLADWGTFRGAEGPSFGAPSPVDPRFQKYFSYGIAGLIVALHVAHIATMPRVPLLEKWLHKGARSKSLVLMQTSASGMKKIHEETAADFSGIAAKFDSTYPERMASAFRVYGDKLRVLRENEKKLLNGTLAALPDVTVEEGRVLREYLAKKQELYDYELALIDRYRRQMAEMAAADALAKINEYARGIGGLNRNATTYYEQMAFKLQNVQEDEFKLLRDKASKLLHVPAVFIYACQGALFIVPVVVLGLFQCGGILPAIFMILFSLFYSRVTLAKGPLYVMVFLYTYILWTSLSGRVKRYVFTGALIVVAPLGYYAGHFYWDHPLSIFNFRVPVAIQEKHLGHSVMEAGKGKLLFSIQDHYRLANEYRTQIEEYKQATSLDRSQLALNFFAYRAFLGPVEVSNRWYTFFPDVSGGYAGFEGLTPSSRGTPNYQHPSNRLGIWAYVRRFPSYYADTINAYASADADAHARWGIPGLIILCLLIFALRQFLRVVRGDQFFERCLYYSSLVILGVGLPQASLQAIVVAQGLGVFLALSILHHVLTVVLAGKGLPRWSMRRRSILPPGDVA